MPGGPSQFDQTHYRWMADDGAIGSETPLANEDASHDVLASVDTTLRLHVQVADTINGATPKSAADKQLEFRHHNGTSWSSWANVTGATSFIRAIASTHFADSDACTDDLTDSSSNVFFASLGADENNGVTISFGYAGDTRHQGCWNLQTQSADLDAGDQIELRIKISGGDITNYVVTAHLDIIAGSPVYEVAEFRGRRDDGGELAPPTGASWEAALNANFSKQLEEAFRIRCLIKCTVAGESLAVIWEAAKNGGAFADITALSNVVIVNSPHFAQNDDCTALLGSGTFIVDNNGMRELTGAPTNLTTVAGEEWNTEACLVLRAQPLLALLVVGDFFDVRPKGFDTYTKTCRITLEAGGAGPPRTQMPTMGI